MKKKISSRIKAAAVCAALLTTSVVTPSLVMNLPVITSITADAASTTTVSQKLDADDSYSVDTYTLGSSIKKITFHLESSEKLSKFVYGFGIGVTQKQSTKYWLEYDAEKGFVESTDSKGNAIEIAASSIVPDSTSFDITIDVSGIDVSYDQGGATWDPAHLEFRNYYSDGQTVTLKSIEINGSGTVTTPSVATDDDDSSSSTKEDTNPASADDTFEINQALSDDTSDKTASIFSGYTGDYATSGIKTMTFILESDEYLDSFSFGFGIGVVDEPYWYEYSADGSWVDTNTGKAETSKRNPTSKEFAVTIDVSELDLKYDTLDDVTNPEYAGHFEFRNYFSNGSNVTVKQLIINTSNDPDEGYTTSSDGIGYGEDTQTEIIQGDGTVTFKNTITRRIYQPSYVNGGTGAITLTPGFDEIDYYDENGVLMDYSEESGDPINSHKFALGAFGVSGSDAAQNVEIQSISVTLKTTDNEVATRFMYGAGISVEYKSIADTEYPKAVAGVKSKNSGYWYNDCGAEELDLFNQAMEIYKTEVADAVDVITPQTGHDITDSSVLGSYFTVTWELPEEVKEYATLSGDFSFQYWYGEAENGDDYQELGNVEIDAVYVTYTEESTYPVKETKEVSINKTLKADDKYEVSYADLGIESYQDVYAATFNVDVTEGSQLTYAFGTSYNDEDYFMSTKTTLAGDANYCITDAQSTNYDLTWIFPQTLAVYNPDSSKDENYVNANGSLGFYNFYSALNDESSTSTSIKLNSVTLYYRDGLEVGENTVELGVGDTYTITPTLDDVTYSSGNEKVVTVDKDGTLTGIAPGKTNVTVVSSDGQTVTITVTVVEGETEATTEAETTTTTTTITTEAPTETTTKKQISVTKWGDVNVDGDVNVGDVVLLNKAIVNAATLSDQGECNADCYNDSKISSTDSLTILQLLVMTYSESDMPIVPEG